MIAQNCSCLPGYLEIGAADCLPSPYSPVTNSTRLVRSEIAQLSFHPTNPNLLLACGAANFSLALIELSAFPNSTVLETNLSLANEDFFGVAFNPAFVGIALACSSSNIYLISVQLTPALAVTIAHSLPVTGGNSSLSYSGNLLISDDGAFGFVLGQGVISVFEYLNCSQTLSRSLDYLNASLQNLTSGIFVSADLLVVLNSADSSAYTLQFTSAPFSLLVVSVQDLQSTL